MVGFVSNQNPEVVKVEVKQATLKPSGCIEGTWTAGLSSSPCPGSSPSGEGSLCQAVVILNALSSHSSATLAMPGLESSRRSQRVD